MKKKPTKKLPWKDVEVIKIRLNPEQAVISCCNSTFKLEIHEGGQCIFSEEHRVYCGDESGGTTS